jgi:hypothetical protein
MDRLWLSHSESLFIIVFIEVRVFFLLARRADAYHQTRCESHGLRVLACPKATTSPYLPRGRERGVEESPKLVFVKTWRDPDCARDPGLRVIPPGPSCLRSRSMRAWRDAGRSFPGQRERTRTCGVGSICRPHDVARQEPGLNVVELGLKNGACHLAFVATAN